MDGEPKKPGNYLSIDGGPSGLPALYTLEELFNRLQDDLKSDKELVPRRWFDIIIGTGRGAIIALLLGKLGLTVSQAIDAYRKLEPILSAKPAQNDGERANNTDKFKKVFMNVLSEANVKNDAPMLDEAETKTIICVANAVNVSIVHLIRSYPVRGIRAAPCTILEAACACIAFPDSFLPVIFGTGHKRMTLVDAVAGYANPTKELFKEAQKIFGDNGEVATVFSIGAGSWNVQVSKGGGYGIHLDEAVKRGVIGSEQVHQDLQTRLLKTALYYRFNIDRELDNESDVILAYISAYLGEGVTNSRLDEAIKRIQTRPLGARLKDINSVEVIEIKLKPRPRVVPHFIGRDDILDAMRRFHFNGHQGQQQQLPKITILSGIGGLGKTQTALKFALEFEGKYLDIPVFFLDASTAETLKTDLETVVRSRGTKYHANSYKDALVWLSTELKNWLVILDSADDPNVDLVHHIPQCAHGHVIITTRNATFAALAPNTSYALEGLSTPDAVTLLLTASNYPDDEDNRRQAAEIVLELGSLPLALAHAAGYIFVHRCLGTYLNMYRQNRERILASTNSRIMHDYRSSVAMTIEMSFGKLSEQAQDILRLFSHLQATSIPLAMIVKAAERQFRRVERTERSSLKLETLKQADELMKIFCSSGEWSEFDFNESIYECLQYSLLQLTAQNNHRFFAMHVLVQSHLQRAALIHGHLPMRLISRLLGSAITVEHKYDFLAFNRLLRQHIQLLQIEDVAEAGDHYSLGYVLSEVGDFELALVHWERCVEIWRAVPGEDDSNTIVAMNYLALSYGQAGKNQAAQEHLEEVLSLRRRVLGPEHPHTVESMGNLATSYRTMGKNQAAVALEEEVLSLRKRLLGPEHEHTVLSMGNLAVFYLELGKNQAALELMEEVLLLQRRLLGPEHSGTTLAMSNLAGTYKRVSKIRAALELDEQVLSFQRRLLGPEHPETLYAGANLAVSYKNLGKNQDALELGEEVLSLQKRQLGPEHPHTMRTMANLTGFYKNLGKDRAALELGEELVSLRRRLLGPEHPHTVLAMGTLAGSYTNLGRNHAALELDEQVLSLQRRLLGPEHPDTVRAMGNLAVSHTSLGNNQAALELEERVLSLQKALLGLEHPDTILTMGNLAVSYKNLGRNQDALEIEEEVLLLQMRLIGPEHPDTVIIMGNLAVSYKDAGRNQAALEMEEKVLSLRKEILGQQHPETIRAMRNLLRTYKWLDMQAQRLELLKIAVPAHETAELFGVDHPTTVKLRNDLRRLSARHASGSDRQPPFSRIDKWPQFTGGLIFFGVSGMLIIVCYSLLIRPSV